MTAEAGNGASGGPDVSVIVPVVERHDDLDRLYDEFAGELERLGRSYEFIVVVDGPMEDTIRGLREFRDARGAPMTIIVLRRPVGEAAALACALERVTSNTVMTLAAYFQVEPSGVGEALALVDSGKADLVVGRRFPRRDSVFNRMQAAVFHAIVSLVTRTRFHDISCGFRVMSRRVADELVLYGDLHRFIPILALIRGFGVREIEIPQRVEDRPLRVYNFGTYLRRLLDIVTIFFLAKFTSKPLRFFGLIGSAIFGAGAMITLYLGLYRLLGFGGIAGRPLLLLGLLLMVLGIQSLSLGLLGELVIFTHARQIREAQIAEIV